MPLPFCAFASSVSLGEIVVLQQSWSSDLIGKAPRVNYCLASHCRPPNWMQEMGEAEIQLSLDLTPLGRRG